MLRLGGSVVKGVSIASISALTGRAPQPMSSSSSSPPPFKKMCEPKSIGTHDGTFHCDEALACFMLQQLPEYVDARIVRTRKPDVLAPCDVVVDVGGVYDPSNHRYDHHQRSFSDTMQSLTEGKKKWQTKLSSAGLVYLHFGRRVIASIADINEDAPVIEDLYDYVYTNFVEEIDAVDNGISDRTGEPRYKTTSTISQRVGHLNPAWNDEDSESDSNLRFTQAMDLVGKELSECIRYFKASWLPARQIVEEAIKSCHEIHSSGEVLKLSTSCPWKEHLFDLEESQNISPSIKYVLYKEKVGTKWRVQAVPTHPSSFENRLSLPEPWRGVRDNDLCTLSGIEGCIFVHSGGFIGGNLTYEGALKMATTSLEQAKIESENTK